MEVLKLVGLKRLVIALILLGGNAVLFFAVYGVMAPQLTTQERDLLQTQSEANRYQQDLNTIRDEFDQLGGQQQVFEMLTQRAFFSPVDPRLEQQLFVDVQIKSGVQAYVTISGRKNVELEGLDEVNWTVTKSRVVVDITAVDDVDIYRYVKILLDTLPGYVKVMGFDVERNMEYSADVLREIVRGNFPDFLKADLELEWYFMVPPSSASVN